MTDPTQPPVSPEQPAAPVYQPAPTAYQYAQPTAPVYSAQPPTNTMAIISLVSAFFVSILAIVLGHLALSQIKRTGESGRGLALAGLIIGYVGVVGGLLVAIFYIVVIVIFGGTALWASGYGY